MLKSAVSSAQSLIQRAKHVYTNHGMRSLGKRSLRLLYNKLLWAHLLRQPVRRLGVLYYETLHDEKFEFRNKEYSYFYHTYNFTWRNERAVEIPIIRKYLHDCEGEILEVGNVLSHYFQLDHDIVDKYESAPDVINEDIVDFSSAKQYDLVISISTFEHIGWDETPKEPEKPVRAVENLQETLAPGGKIVITVPLGYNPNIDRLVAPENQSTEEVYYLKRVGRQRWEDVSWSQVRDVEYNNPYQFANGVAVAVFTKNEE